MKHLKPVLIFLYVTVIVVMAAATIVERHKGTAHVGEYWYGSWWFSVLWALLAAAGIAWFVKRRVRKVFAVVLHLSFIVILAGALLTQRSSPWCSIYPLSSFWPVPCLRISPPAGV